MVYPAEFCATQRRLTGGCLPAWPRLRGIHQTLSRVELCVGHHKVSSPEVMGSGQANLQ